MFANRNIFNLWSGQIVSQSGDSIYEIALLWILLELTGSNSTTGLIAMAGYLPALLFGLFFSQTDAGNLGLAICTSRIAAVVHTMGCAAGNFINTNDTLMGSNMR